MKPNAPTTTFWWIAMILGVLGIIAHFVTIPFVTEYNYWFLFAGFLVFAAGTSFKGL